jgi:hypothetical protein
MTLSQARKRYPRARRDRSLGARASGRRTRARSASPRQAKRSRSVLRGVIHT